MASVPHSAMTVAGAACLAALCGALGIASATAAEEGGNSAQDLRWETDFFDVPLERHVVPVGNVAASALKPLTRCDDFVANEVQSETAMMGIRMMFSTLPAALAIAGAVFIFFYRIDARTIQRMEDELATLHAPAAAT